MGFISQTYGDRLSLGHSSGACNLTVVAILHGGGRFINGRVSTILAPLRLILQFLGLTTTT
jgi:hypothetical protein